MAVPDSSILRNEIARLIDKIDRMEREMTGMAGIIASLHKERAANKIRIATLEREKAELERRDVDSKRRIGAYENKRHGGVGISPRTQEAARKPHGVRGR